MVPGRSLMRASPVAGGGYPEGLAAGHVEDPGGAVGHGQDGRQVAGGRDGAGLAGGVDDGVRAGDEGVLGQREGGPVELPHDFRRRQVQVRQRVGGRAEPGHDGGGQRAVAHHVADDQPGPVPGQRDDVVPVAAGVAAGGRQAPPGDLKPALRPRG